MITMSKDYVNLNLSARYAAEDITREYQEKLIEEAFCISENNDISVKNLFIAKERIEQKNYSLRINKRKKFFFLMAGAGFLYTLAGLLLYMYQNLSFNIDKDLGLLIATLGFFVSLVSILFYKIVDYSKVYNASDYQSKGFVNDSYYNDKVIKLWSNIENLGHNLMKLDDYTTSDNLSSVIDYLNAILRQSNEFIDLKKILQIRNSIIHGKIELSKNELDEILSAEYDIIGRLEFMLEKKKKSDKGIY